MLNRWNFLKTGFYEGINFMGADDGSKHHFFPPLLAHPLDKFKRRSVEITEAQKTRIREQATLHIPDRAINPVLPPLGNAQVDAIGDVPVGKEYLDIAWT